MFPDLFIDNIILWKRFEVFWHLLININQRIFSFDTKSDSRHVKDSVWLPEGEWIVGELVHGLEKLLDGFWFSSSR